MQTNEPLSLTIEPDAIDAYVHQLLTCCAFTPCDRKLQVFAVQDIIPDKMCLKVNHLMSDLCKIIVCIPLSLTRITSSTDMGVVSSTMTFNGCTLVHVMLIGSDL